MKQNVFLSWLAWHFLEAPKEIIKGWKNILAFNWNYFSVPLLFKTFFAYWRQYRWHYPRGFDLGQYLEVFFSNIISRALGAVTRTIIILLGIIIETGIIVLGLMAFLVWLAMPLIAAGLFFKGLNLMF